MIAITPAGVLLAITRRCVDATLGLVKRLGQRAAPDPSQAIHRRVQLAFSRSPWSLWRSPLSPSA